MIDIIVTVLGAIVLVLGLASKRLEESPLPATLLALLAGILLGPEGFGVLDPLASEERSSILEICARLTLGVGLMGVALRVPKAYPLLLRRPPALWLLRHFLPSLRSKADALFLGWFGPIAVAAIYYSAMAEHRLKQPLVWDVVSLIICASVVAHGTSATPLSRLYRAATDRKERGE